jgi:SAM-dependent methyltransferase
MTIQRSQWLTRELARTFLEDVRGAIPGAEIQLEVLKKIVQEWRPSPSRILDLGCGDGILGRTLLMEYPGAKVVFADFSEPMLEALQKRINNAPAAEIVLLDFSSPSWTERVASWKSFDVVVSSFAIHHQPDARKRELFAEIHHLLAQDGIFLNLEHVSSTTAAGEKLFDSYFVDHLVRFHRKASPQKTRPEIEEAYYQRPDKKENILAPVDAQCDWLRALGFQDVDCFFKIFELALFGGRKAPRAGPQPTKS